MHCGNEHVFHKVLVAGCSSLGTYTAPILRLEFRQRSTLHVSKVRNCDYNLFVCVEIFRIHIFRSINDFGLAFVAVFFLNFKKFVLDYLHSHFYASKQFLQVLDALHQFFVLGTEFFLLETGQLAETHFNDCRCLNFREIETLHQSFLCFGRIVRRLDYLNNLVDIVACYD